MKKLLFAALIMSQCVMNVYAKQAPLSYASDERIKKVAYQDNNVVSIEGSPFTTTQIIFSKGEVIEDIEGGDSSSWMIAHQANIPNMLFLKPTSLGLKSNLSIVTNHHTYYFELNTLASPDEIGHQTYAVKFIYPLDEKKKLAQKLKEARAHKDALINTPQNPKEYNWAYSFSGNKQVMPLHVFDDGRFTYFELRPNQDVPAVFAIQDKTGKESVLNMRKKGNYLLVHLIAPQFTLRQGSRRVVSIFNHKRIKAVRG
jgi:type IV secretion system protein VirB9